MIKSLGTVGIRVYHQLGTNQKTNKSSVGMPLHYCKNIKCHKHLKDIWQNQSKFKISIDIDPGTWVLQLYPSEILE